MENANYYEEDGLIHVSFQFFGKKDKGFYFHQPGICDGGWIISGYFDPNKKIYKVRYSEDSFVCSRLKSEISFEPKKNVDYVVYLGKTRRGKELRLKGSPFKYEVRPKTPEELEQERLERIRRSKELRKQLGLPDGEFTPEAIFPLIRRSNPTLIRNKIFTEFPKETPESNTLNIHCVTMSSDSWQKVPSLDGSVEDDLARIISEENLVNAMTSEHSKDETLKGLEQLRKIISSEPTKDNKGE